MSTSISGVIMIRKFSLLLKFFCCLLALPANAHHNFVSHYDMGAEPVSIEGIVQSFWFVNPHIRIYVDVDGNDAKETWVVEGRSRNILSREGWTGGEIKQGNTISVSGTPATKLKNHMLLSRVFVEGEEFRPQALERKLKEFQLGGDGAGTVSSHLDRAGMGGGTPDEQTRQ